MEPMIWLEMRKSGVQIFISTRTRTQQAPTVRSPITGKARRKFQTAIFVSSKGMAQTGPRGIVKVEMSVRGNPTLAFAAFSESFHRSQLLERDLKNITENIVQSHDAR